MLTAMDNQELLFMALEAGADGYLLKRTKPSDLRQALLDVLGGGVPMTSQIECVSRNLCFDRILPWESDINRSSLCWGQAGGRRG